MIGDKPDLSTLTADQKARLLNFAPSAGSYRSGGPGNGPGTLPSIPWNNRELREISEDAMRALVSANDPPELFLRAGKPVRIRRDEKDQPLIEPVGVDALRGILARAANFTRITGNGRQVCVPPPTVVVRDILALKDLPFPALVGLTELPIVRGDGSIVYQSGYDPATRLYYAPPPGFSIPPVSDSPSEQEIRDAVAILDELFADFPFVDAASRAAAWAALISPILRPAIAGPAPLVLIDAPVAGTGKSLLADCIARIATGRPGAMMAIPGDDDEMRKRLTALLMAGTSVIIFDNIERRLDIASLAAAITAATWQDRVLGSNAEISLPVRVTWLATGNNIQLGGDLPRRCIWCRLDARVARPWKRSGFKHEDLPGWVTGNRSRLSGAILTLVGRWFSKGRPRLETPVLGGFQEWAEAIGSILEVAGIEGFLDNLDRLHEQSDAETAQWEAFLGAWEDRYGQEPRTVGELTEDMKREHDQHGPQLVDLLPESLADSLEKPQSFKRKLGNALARKAEVRFGNRRIVKAGEKQRATLWAVLRDAPRPEE